MDEAPSFPGFPEDGVRFLRDLAENNNRDWFKARKAQYLAYVLEPAKELVVALGERLQSLSEGIRYDTRSSGGSIMRIYRDVRFSKDKTPYEPNVRVYFWEGEGRRMENPGFYLRIEPDTVDVYAGAYEFAKPVLAAYRDAVVDEARGAALEAAIAAVRGAGNYQLGGEHYKRVPRGYDAQHARADLLRHSGLWAHAPNAVEAAQITTPELVEVCWEHCRNIAPLHHWLVQLRRDMG